jgi:hypothetical protein
MIAANRFDPAQSALGGRCKKAAMLDLKYLQEPRREASLVKAAGRRRIEAQHARESVAKLTLRSTVTRSSRTGVSCFRCLHHPS